MWVQVIVLTLAVTPSPSSAPTASSPSVAHAAITWTDVVAAAAEAPVAVAAAAGARALQDASGRLAPIDGLRAELQPGAQFRPFDAITSPAAQLVLEGTSGAGALLGSRRDQTRNDAAVLDAEAAALRLERRLQLSDAWCDRRAAELAEAAARTALEDARQLQGRLERLHREPAAGLVLAVDDVIAVRAVVAEAALAVLDAEAARLEAGLRLGRLLGRAAEVAASGELPTPAALPSTTPSSTMAEGPEVARAEAAVVAAKAALLAHERELWPTVGLGVQAQVDDASTGFAYGRLSLSLPRVDGDPRGRAELVARVHLAEAELIELRRARAERLSTAHHEVEHQQHTLQLVEEALVPAAIARREVAEKRHALGAGEVFELVAAARAEHEARRRAALARVGVARARVTLALLDPGHLDAHGPDGTADHEGHAGHHDDDTVIPSPVQPQEPR